jgi:flagellar biosynthetic protein FliO
MASASTLMLFARLILSLAVVIGLMWVAANVLRKRGFSGVAGRRATRGPDVELLARRQLGRNASIAIVRVAGRSIVVGVTDHQVTMLDDIEITDIALDEGNTWTVSSGAANTDSPASAWKMMLDQMRTRTVRR